MVFNELFEKARDSGLFFVIHFEWRYNLDPNIRIPFTIL